MGISGDNHLEDQIPGKKFEDTCEPAVFVFVCVPKIKDLEKPRDGVLGHGWPRCRNKDPHVLYMRWGESEERLHEESMEEGHV